MFPTCEHVLSLFTRTLLFSDFRSSDNSLEHIIISSQFHLSEVMNVYAVIVY